MTSEDSQTATNWPIDCRNRDKSALLSKGRPRIGTCASNTPNARSALRRTEQRVGRIGRGEAHTSQGTQG